MFTVTPNAARQIILSAKQGKSEGLPLRIAASTNADSSIHYGMGFDDKKDDDTSIVSKDIKIVIAPVSLDLLKNITLDYVELEPGKFEFIFINRNNPTADTVQS